MTPSRREELRAEWVRLAELVSVGDRLDPLDPRIGRARRRLASIARLVGGGSFREWGQS